jgi:hypothetical protein
MAAFVLIHTSLWSASHAKCEGIRTKRRQNLENHKHKMGHPRPSQTLLHSIMQFTSLRRHQWKKGRARWHVPRYSQSSTIVTLSEGTRMEMAWMSGWNYVRTGFWWKGAPGPCVGSIKLSEGPVTHGGLWSHIYANLVTPCSLHSFMPDTGFSNYIYLNNLVPGA